MFQSLLGLLIDCNTFWRHTMWTFMGMVSIPFGSSNRLQLCQCFFNSVNRDMFQSLLGLLIDCNYMVSGRLRSADQVSIPFGSSNRLQPLQEYIVWRNSYTFQSLLGLLIDCNLAAYFLLYDAKISFNPFWVF